jgi:hypothetical protein
VQLQLGRILDRHDALFVADEARNVEQRRFPAPVPPLIRRFIRARTQCDESRASAASTLQVTRSSALSRSDGTPDRQRRAVRPAAE